MNLTEEQLHTLRHTLGINDRRFLKEPYRNHSAANPGDEKLHELARLGAMELYATTDEYEWFRCTEAGRAAALESQAARHFPKKKRVYQAFLDVADLRPRLTFREFLTSDEYRESRKRA